MAIAKSEEIERLMIEKAIPEINQHLDEQIKAHCAPQIPHSSTKEPNGGNKSKQQTDKETQDELNPIGSTMDQDFR